MSWRIKDCATETYTEDNQYNMKKITFQLN